MARKRASRSRGDSSNPNKVLIVFLVLFILTTLGLGGWIYSMFADRHRGQQLKEEAQKILGEAKTREEWAMLQVYEMRAQGGDAAVLDEKSTDFDQWKTFRAAAIDSSGAELKFIDNGKYKAFDKDRKPFEEAVKTGASDLGWNQAGHRYVKSYRDLVNELRAALKKAQDQHYAVLLEKTALETKYNSMAAVAKTERDKAFTEIKTGNEATLAAAKARTKEMTDALNRNATLQGQITKTNEEFTAYRTRQEAKIRELEEKIALGGLAGGEKDPKAPRPSIAQPHALVLDISRGKPLWDRARGKLLTIDDVARRVTIDLGAEDGVRPHMTFNVFAAGWGDRPEGPFKGTVEVVRADPKTSLAKITSVYDAQGTEISLNDPSPAKILREGSNAWKTGDLLFNLGWGTHVAVAGVIEWTGRRADSPAAQAEEMNTYLRLLGDQGIKVDTHVDPRDGQRKGNLTARTAYLIVGHLAGNGQSGDVRTKAVNDGLAALRKEAAERGMFIISADNFANVLGYRPPRSRTDTELSAFRPGMPAGGAILSARLGDDVSAAALAELTGKWSGKLSGGGTLRLSFKGDGGCVWELQRGVEPKRNYTPLTSAGNQLTAVIDNTPVTLRLVDAGRGLHVAGTGLEATLRKE
ncbi:MAG: hypothetical protein IT295_14025 [Dehalococcoidia bacterium]|nr:hypothetical protein [Dehalococcoidia bacterium]